MTDKKKTIKAWAVISDIKVFADLNGLLLIYRTQKDAIGNWGAKEDVKEVKITIIENAKR